MSPTHGPHLRLRRNGRYSRAMLAAPTLALFALALIAIPGHGRRVNGAVYLALVPRP